MLEYAGVCWSMLEYVEKHHSPCICNELIKTMYVNLHCSINAISLTSMIEIMIPGPIHVESLGSSNSYTGCAKKKEDILNIFIKSKIINIFL